MTITSTSRWHFACTDLEEMLTSTLSIGQDPENDENTVQSTIVEEFGFYSTVGSSLQGFHVDEISFSSEFRQLDDQYVSMSVLPLTIKIT